MADDDPWLLKEDGFLNVGAECSQIVYHPNLNVLLITTAQGQLHVFDVNCGAVLQKCSLSGKAEGKLQGVYLGEGVDKILYTDGRSIGVRGDYNGVLLLDTILQMPIFRSEDTIKLEMLLSDAILLHHCLRSVELPGVDHVQEVLQELSTNIAFAKTSRKKGIKAQKWNTVCLELSHGALKLVCSNLVTDLKRLSKHIPALPIASAISERLNGLLPGLVMESGNSDKVLMYSEAARRDTFSKWPHMNYKWALPEQMAQAGFYHQPNSTGEDRAMCFTCNVCLVCWEPTDEPWSEHERHSPACPFVKGEYTQNVPLSVTLATAPAQAVGESVDVISTTNVAGLIATASHNGFINVWNVTNQLKKEVSFYISLCEGEANNKDSFQFVARKTSSSSSFLPSLVSETDSLSEAYKASTSLLSSSSRVQVTALALVDGPKSRNESKSSNSNSSMLSSEGTGASSSSVSVGPTSIRPCLVSGVSVSSSSSAGVMSSAASSAQQQMRTLENVWAASSDLASSSSLVRAMNSVNSAASSNSLDIMKVATAASGATCTSARSHYLVLCDFHHKTAQPQTLKKDTSKDSTKSKKQLSGTGTSASSNGIRQESLYQEILLGKLLLGEINEDVDSEMVGTHFDSIYASPHTVLATPTANGIFYNMPANSSIPTSSSFDANSNPISSYVPEQYASTSKMSQLRKTLDTIKTSKAEPVVIQSIHIETNDLLKINNVLPTKDGRHLFVTLCPQEHQTTTTESFSNTNQMDVDDETLPKSFMYWDHNDVQSKSVINGAADGSIGGMQINEMQETSSHAILLVYALDFTDKTVRLKQEPILRRELPPDQAPTECVLLPAFDKPATKSSSSSYSASTCMRIAAQGDKHIQVTNSHEPRGQVALVCRDGVIRLLDLNSLSTVTEAKLDGRKFISAAFCTRLERLCACTSDGALHFFSMTTEDDSTEEKDVDDLQMITETSVSDESEIAAPSTSSLPSMNQDHILAYRPNLTYTDLRMLYDLTRFDRHSPAYGATVPPCWSEMMQAQRQRRYPQHLHQSEDQHHTRTWRLQRLQNDTTTWDEHIFELTLPRSAAGNVGHVDVRFSLHFPCLELPMIQVTLLKQNMTGIGSKSHLTPVDEKIDFKIGREQKADNPVITEEYQRHHNTEILCGPVNLIRCMDLSDNSGCVTLTSPKLFRTRAKTLLVHIKALVDPTKEGVSSKSRSSLLESKPPTSKKLRIDETGPLPPGATVERFATNATKKLDCYNGCDWIHEISVTVRSVQPTNIPSEKLQRCAMLESKIFIDNLLNVACLQTSDKSPVAQSLALDILIWVAAIRLTRLRTGLNSTRTKAMQLETVRSIQKRLPCLLRTCLLHAGRSIAHKCVKLIVLCSEGLQNLDDPAPHSFEEAVLSVLVSLLPYIVSIQWAGSLRWLAILVTKLLPLDRNHSVTQQCINLIQEISVEMSKRSNPYRLLLATRFGLYNSPFETELFDMDPPVSPKSSSVPVTNTYSSIATGEQQSLSVTSMNSSYTQDTIDLRDLLSLPSSSAGDLIVPSKLKALCANHSMKGLLEVEPLHFTCHAASDGTKMEKIDPSVNTITLGGTLYDSAAPPTNAASDTKIIHHAYNFEAGSLGPDLQAKLTTKLTDLLSQCSKNAQKANFDALTKKAQGLFTLDDQSDSDEASNIHCNATHIWSVYSDKPPTLTSVPKEKSSSITNIGTSSNKVEDIGAKKRDDVAFPWGRLLCWPPQQALVVERMHSGARRFVILDFGAPILLTDLMIPACSDLVSLSIDIWTKSEESDGIRLVVAGDIGSKPLVVNDLQPPPVCRYLKITTIGRYGMSTTRCKIPLGMFYGHMVVLPGEDYSELTASGMNVNNLSDPVLQNTIESQCTILSALAEDVQCRFTLATERLKSYLEPLLCTETPNVIHMQHYLSHSKNPSDSKDQPSAKILSTYQECIMYQHQLNIIRGVWQRLETWKNSEGVPPTTLASASNDKLRILGETLLDILLYTVYEIGPTPSIPTPLYESFTPAVCEKLFNSICVMTPAPHLQLYVVALLAKMAGHQPWWGNFLANTLINLYSESSTHIFPQDRVFILLTFLGRKSLIAAANKSSVVDAMVRTLGRLLTPLSTGQTGNSCRLDTTLIGWVLLFLSVCLDTTAAHPTSLEDNHDKSKEQGMFKGFSSRWEFIQGELAMQRKFVSSSRSSASRSYRKKLQKRLMHHKQQLQDLEQAKKSFHSSPQGSTFSTKLEAALKSQERFYKKTLKQHSSAKHLKDLLGMRRNELPHLGRSSRSQSQPSTSQVEPLESDNDYSSTLSHQYVLPVARGLVALLLNNASNVDMFLLGCKVVARLVVSTRPAITLSELMREDQLLKLIRLATGISDTAWSSHAVSCLLQDLLEGEKMYPKHATSNEVNVSEETFETLPAEEARIVDDDSVVVAGTSASSNAFGNDEGFADGDEDTQDSIIIAPTNTSTSKSGGFNLPSLLESDDSEFEDFLDNILERGKTILKKGSASSKYPTITSSGISQAIDARLEYGVETSVEITLRRLSALGTYNLPYGINSTINPTAELPRHSQASTSRQSSFSDHNQDTWNQSDSLPSSLCMLTNCFDKIFTELYIQSMGTNLELVLQLWLTLNLDASSDSNSTTFDPSLTPVIPLNSPAISGLISAFSWHPGVSLRAWCYALQCLTLASNQPLQAEQVDAASCSTPLDGLLGGMAGCIIKERNMGPMLLRLLSGNGLNVDTANKHFGMAGPTLCQALQDFLVRLQMRCDVITPGSALGNSLKELLLWVVYQLVQPGGALVARRGPLDAQCKLITSLLNLNFTNTDLGTAMSISECVGELVSTYVRGTGVVAQCGGTTDSTNQSGGFGGLYACVLGGDSRQTRPASWDSLVVALIKLVCRLVQTPLPNVRNVRSDSTTDMELGENLQIPISNQIDSREKMNTSQTDESKVAEQQTARSHQTSKPKVPCVADTVLQHEPTMMRLLGALGHSSGSSLAMLIGEGSSSNATTELTAPPSIPDATFQLLCTLTRKASNPTLVLNPVYQYLASSCRQVISDRHMDQMQLSEPLLWFILRVLDNEASLSVFTSMGGVRVLCENLVRSSKNCNGNHHHSRGVIALVMQHLSNATGLTPVVSSTSSSSSSSKKSTNTLESSEDGLLNFAPLGTVSWLHPTAQAADVLIQSATPHRRARNAAWSYHFYPDEAWVDLTITLPCAILLKEVELHPHLASLSTCPSAVALEISREGNTALTPICPPMPTAGLTFIRLTLSQPEVTTAVLVRLYKPRDSTNISLSQIRLLGTTAFGDSKSNYDTIDEEQLTKTSLGWLRLVHQCLSVSTVNSNLTIAVLNSAASVDGLVESCCNLLLLPTPSLFTPNLEKVLLQLGLHSCELGLRLINLLLNNRTVPLLQTPALGQEMTTVQMVVELLEQLCSAQDVNTKSRMSAVLSWLYIVAKTSVSDEADDNLLGTSNNTSPPAIYIHCISTIIWKAAKLTEVNYNLKELLTEDLFDVLYQWTLSLKTHTALKQAIDSVLCSFCFVKPSFFQSILQKVQMLVPNLTSDQSDVLISDDHRESEGQTDDSKSSDLNEWYTRLAQSEFKCLSLTEGQLLSIAAVSRSSAGVCQLINSGLPTLLVACIMEFAILEKSKQVKDQRQHAMEKMVINRIEAPSCSSKSAGSSSGLTDSDKAKETPTEDNETVGLDMTEPENIAVILEFFSLICSEGKMRDWLGREGNGFWLPLLRLLSDRPIENPSASLLRCSKKSISFAKLENAMIKFLSKCCWCHPNNQKLLAEHLTEVIIEQRAPSGARSLHGISGFTRRLILQLLLESEKILVSVTSDVPMKLSNIANINLPVMPPHPAFPLGHYHHLLYISTQSTVADILQQISGMSSMTRNRELWEPNMTMGLDSLNVAASITAKDKRAKEASNRSQARGPVIRKTRLNADGSVANKSSNNNSQGNTSISNQNYLILTTRPNTPLPPELTVAQLLSIVEEGGVSLSEPCLYLILRQRNKDSKEESTKSSNRSLLTLWTSIDSTLEVFSSKGGLAVLARHLPLVYPDSNRPVPVVEKSPTQELSDTDWVKLEHNENVNEDQEEGKSNNQARTIPPTPQVPPHSLAAFGLFLRLPGYSEVLLRDRRHAQCLLRLALGVTDDGEGGDVLSSPLAASLPTLPFQVLKQLLDDTPPTTDDGLLLRRTSIEVGAVLLLLNCLAIFTHQTGFTEGADQRLGQSGGRSDDKSHLYWAKGTGFGTGSTQQSWNVEQALMRQRSEEEHVTVLLLVIASYIGSGDQPQKELPAAFTELLSRSCLLPALSSYLRNDSVLDMARHIPLYRAILQLLRAMAKSSQLAPLLLPRSSKSGEPSIVSLLSSMKLCVDTYMHKINRTKNSKSKSSSKYPEDTEQDEGLATLIPDIQESATIVHNATARFVEANDEIAGPSPSGPELPLRSVEQRYLEVMKSLQFDTYEMIVENPDGGFKFAVSYHFESNMRAAGERNHPTRVKRLAQEAVTLSTALPLSYSSSVFVRCDTDRLDVMKVLITGPADTPYANGCFEFDVYFPSDYPNNPMMINLETTGRRSVRFNPNLYNDGKVCLSVLNTWHGRPEEKWNAHTSSFLQVLVSIQSLILVSEPYFNEPGYERSRGTTSGALSSQEYNANVCQATAKWAMLDQIRNPCPCFKEVIHTHFWLKRHEIVAQIEGWIRDMEMHGAERRSARTISLSALALRRHYKLLREELNKLPTPEGLEDLAEPLRSPSSPLELSGTPGTPSTPPTSTLTSSTFSNNPPTLTSNNAAETSNHMHHDIDTDVEMEKMVSKVCE